MTLLSDRQCVRFIDDKYKSALRSQNGSKVSRFRASLRRRNIVSDVVQGIIVGGVLAFITFQFVAHAYVTKINGWSTMYGCGEPKQPLWWVAEHVAGMVEEAIERDEVEQLFRMYRLPDPREGNGSV